MHTSRNHRSRVGLIIGIGLLIGLVACAPQATPPLPTLARFPTATNTPLPGFVRPTEQPTFTPTFTRTATATRTHTPTVGPSPTLTVTPSATITVTSSPTPTNTPPLPTLAPESRPLLGLLEVAAQTTLLPTDFPIFTPAPDSGGTNNNVLSGPGIPTAIPPISGVPLPATQAPAPPSCATIASGGFSLVHQNVRAANLVGCPLPDSVAQIPAAWQNFQNGVMVWLNGEIVVLYTSDNSYQTFNDTYTEGLDPEAIDEVGGPGLYVPVRGFLKVWDNNPAVRNGLGYGTIPEQGTTATVQQFERGRMIGLPGRGNVLVIGSDGTWLAVPGAY